MKRMSGAFFGFNGGFFFSRSFVMPVAGAASR